MSTQNEITEKEATTPWTYTNSVFVAKHCYSMARKFCLDLARELYHANLALSNERCRTDVAGGKVYRCTETTECQVTHSGNYIEKQKDSPKTFKDYLADAGIPAKTAYRYLLRYNSTEDRLYTTEELTAIRQAFIDAKIQELQSAIGKPLGWRPDGWNTPCENAYQRILMKKKTDAIAKREFDQAELFDPDYLASIANKMANPTPVDIAEFGDKVKHYKDLCCHAVPPAPQVKIVTFAEKALDGFDQSVRKDVCASLIRMLSLYMGEMD